MLHEKVTLKNEITVRNVRWWSNVCECKISMYSTDIHTQYTMYGVRILLLLLLHEQTTISNGHKIQLLVSKRFFVDIETVMRHFICGKKKITRKIEKWVAKAQIWTKTFCNSWRWDVRCHVQWPNAPVA